MEDRGEERGSTQSSPEPVAMVEGSLEGSMAVFGSFLIYFATFGVINSFGTFQSFYESDYLHTSSSTAIAFIGTLQISLLYLISPLSGALFDSYPIKVSIRVSPVKGHPRFTFYTLVMDLTYTLPSTSTSPVASVLHYRLWLYHLLNGIKYGSNYCLKAYFLA
jgi:hypothetical protein